MYEERLDSSLSVSPTILYVCVCVFSVVLLLWMVDWKEKPGEGRRKDLTIGARRDRPVGRKENMPVVWTEPLVLRQEGRTSLQTIIIMPACVCLPNTYKPCMWKEKEEPACLGGKPCVCMMKSGRKKERDLIEYYLAQTFPDGPDTHTLPF